MQFIKETPMPRAQAPMTDARLMLIEEADADKALPAYQRIKQAILHQIHSGRWQAGQAIPTEMALCEAFGVSRMTVNRALRELSEEKILQRRQGSGTFVAQQQFNHTFVEVRNIAQDIKDTAKPYCAKVLSKRLLGIKAAPSAVQQAFLPITIPTAAKPLKSTQPKRLAEVKIVHYADNEPLQLEERWVDAGLVPAFFEQDFTQVNTSDYLISQVPLESGDYTIAALAATSDVADALAIKPNDPTLLLTRRTVSQGQVVTLVNMWHAGSRYQFTGSL